MQKGITLVALVITVIVLIILAGVTLSTLVGDNGIIIKAQEAKQNMTNAAGEEDMLIQNLLNEIKGIETGGGEIEVPDPPTEPEEPEEPRYPTIESTLSEGKYVWYTDANDDPQKCIVLYGPENENYSSYGIQIITADTVRDITLGSSDFITSRDAYNSAIATLNAEAEKYRKKDDGIAELARCVGSVPDNPNYDGAGMFTCEYSYMSKYNGTFKDRDRNFETDARQMRNIDIDVIGKEYWLTSRTVFYGNTGTNFRLWYMGTNGNWFNQYIVVINKGEAERAYSRTYGLRIVLCLTPEVKVISGDGSEENPYTLAP